jgi:hypothetical protein
MDDRRRGPGGPPPTGGMPAPKPLTDAQKQTVKDLFKKYDIKKLAAVDLKSIMESLDKAGIHGPATREAMELVGITEEKFRSLMPAPPPPGGRMPAPGGYMGPPPGKKERD